MVLLIGNYGADQQQSMQRFSKMMLQGLLAAGIPAELIEPKPLLGRFSGAGAAAAKWLGYLDKFFIFPQRLRRQIARASVVHICDHSNAMYVPRCAPKPVVVTCHDLLAVRGAFGEETDSPASATGKILQRWIVRGLRRANVVACVSAATLRDAQRVLSPTGARPALSVVTLGLNYPYKKLSMSEASSRLEVLRRFDCTRPFVLHVGSNVRRKNRAGVMRIFAQTKDRWDGQLVFAGEPLPAELHSLSQELGIAKRIVEVVHPDNSQLETLYNCAIALVFPSRFEGFGWPIAEAQACGCPVICADGGPLPEVAGSAGLMHPVDDEAGFAADILHLADPAKRAARGQKSLRNAERFSTARMISEYVEIYRTLVPRL